MFKNRAQIKKCGLCLCASWAIGLSAVTWGVVGVIGKMEELPLALRGLAIVIGITGVGFLFFQPPLKSCPRCVSANHRSES